MKVYSNLVEFGQIGVSGPTFYITLYVLCQIIMSFCRSEILEHVLVIT